MKQSVIYATLLLVLDFRDFLIIKLLLQNAKDMQV